MVFWLKQKADNQEVMGLNPIINYCVNCKR
jgi:hypothetical protein